MALQLEEKEQIGNQIAQQLSRTRYACSSFTALNGGTANFLFRGILAQPLEDGTETVVLKHAKEFVAANRNFKLDVTRCYFEAAMLNAFTHFTSTTLDQISIRTPQLYLSDLKTNTHVLEDLSGSIDMRSALKPCTASDDLPQPISTNIGRALGVWLRKFHSWASEPAQAIRQTNIGDNEAMREVRNAISYGKFIDIVQTFPGIWEREGYSKALEEVKNMATAEYKKSGKGTWGENWGIIHADFWSGNILAPNATFLEKQPPENMHLYIIDWELAQFGRREYDLGQMIGDLYERGHFQNIESPLWIIEGFVAGYGPLSDEMAFRIAIHAGVHLICWYIRRDPSAPFTEPLNKIEDVIRIGTDFVVRGWKRDRKWFEGSELKCLFKREYV